MPKRVRLDAAVTPSLKAWVEQEVARGEFADAGEMVEHALRRMRTVTSREEIKALLIEGLDSGPPTPMTKRDWQEIRAEVRRRTGARKSRRKSA